MPGVPSGRACEECRRQKKKCNEAKPRCARCVRLNLECVGSGLRRFKFQNQGIGTPQSDRSASRSGTPKSTNSDSLSVVPSKSLEPASSALKSALIKAMLPTTDFRFNLAWTYGDFFQLMPQRIGINLALDSALEALVAAHSDVCSRSLTVRAQTLSLHSQALQNLRKCLEDPDLANTTETLAAVMVLLILQAFIGADKNYWSQHYVGAAQIFKARNYRYDPDDVFESVLLSALRGPVLMEGILSGKLQFTTKEWRRLMSSDSEDENINDRMVRATSHIPDLLHCRRQLYDVNDSLGLRLESREHYENLKAVANEWSSALDSVCQESTSNPVEAVAGLPLAPILRRQYGLCLFFTIVLNILLRSFPTYEHDLLDDGEHFADEIIILAEQAMPYKPLGASYVILCAAAAYVATRDQYKRSVLSGVFRSYADDFPWAADYKIDAWCTSVDDGFQLPGVEPL